MANYQKTQRGGAGGMASTGIKNGPPASPRQNEEHMCNHCSEGFIRPLQCNLNEAISLCSNIDCDFYLYDTPKDCLILKSALESSDKKYKDCYAGSRFSISSLSPAPSHSSSTDREVELLLNFPASIAALPVIHSDFRPGLERFKTCLSLQNHAEPECSVELEEKSGEMTLSRLDLDFDDPSQHEMPTNVIETEVKKNEEEFKEMLNNGEPHTNAPHTFLDEVLSSWLDDFDNLPTSSNYDSFVENDEKNFISNKFPVANCTKNLIPSAASAFDEIYPQKVLSCKENEMKSNKDVLENTKFSKDCKEGQINLCELNFLSPAGSGISEDSGYNDDDFSRGHSKVLMHKSSFITPIKNKSSETNEIISHNSLLKLNNSFCHRSTSNLSLSNLFTFLDVNAAINNENYIFNNLIHDPCLNSSTSSHKPSTISDQPKSSDYISHEHSVIENSFSSGLVQVAVNNNNLELKDSKPISLTFSSSLDKSISSLMEPDFFEDLGTNNMVSNLSSVLQVGDPKSTFSPIKEIPTKDEAETVCSFSQNIESSLAVLNKKINLETQEIFVPINNAFYNLQTEILDCPIVKDSKVELNTIDNKIMQFGIEEESSLTQRHNFQSENTNESSISLCQPGNVMFKEVCCASFENNSEVNKLDKAKDLKKLPNGIVVKNNKINCAMSVPKSSMLSTCSSTPTLNLSANTCEDEIPYIFDNESSPLSSIKNMEGFSKHSSEYSVEDSSSPIYKNESTTLESELHFKKFSKQVEVDPWSIPEIYIDELDIEVTLESLPKSVAICNSESYSEKCDKKVTSESSLPTRNNSSPKLLEILPCKVNYFKPITLTPEVINLNDYPFKSISHSENREVRLSVGFKSPAKTACNDESVGIFKETGGQFEKSNYFSSLLSSVVFDESFLHTAVEDDNDKENSIEKEHSIYFFDKYNSVSKNNLQKFPSESEMAIICVNSNDEPQIYSSGKRKVDLIDNIYIGENPSCSDVKRQKLFHKNNGSFLTDKIKLSPEDGQNDPFPNISESCSFYKNLEFANINCSEAAKKFQSHSKCSAKLNTEQGACNSKYFATIATQKLLVNSPEIKKQINILRQKSDINLPRISCQSPPNYKAINTNCFAMFKKLDYYGNIRKSPVLFHQDSQIACEESDLSNLCDSNDFSIFNYESKGDKNTLDLPFRLENNSSEDNSKDVLNLEKGFSGRQYLPSQNCIEYKNKLKVGSKIKTIKDNKPRPDYILKNKLSYNAKLSSNKVSIPKYMSHSFKSDYYYKEIPKRKYIEKEVNIKSNIDDGDKIPSLLLPNSTDSQVLEFLTNSGWAVTPCSPLINYEVPSNAKTPTIIPPALKSLYGKTGSDVILWTMTDANVNVNDLPSNHDSNINFKKNEKMIKNSNKYRKNLSNAKLVSEIQLNKLSKISKPTKFSDTTFYKTNFLNQDPTRFGLSRTSFENNKTRSENDNMRSEGLIIPNLSPLKIGNNNIFLPPLSILKQANIARIPKQPDNDEIKTNGFIELPDDNLAYKEVCSNGFYSVKAPTVELAYSRFNSHSQSYGNYFEKKKKFKSKRSEKKSIKALSPQTPPLSETSSEEPAELLDSSQIIAENNLVESIKQSDQPPSFYCVAHKSKTYIFHRKET